MKNKINIIYVLFAMLFAFASCTPDQYSMGTVIDKSDLKYNITQNPDDPNMVILESLTNGLAPRWTTPYGPSLLLKDTVKIAFPGTYQFTYGVMSAGGYVYTEDVEVIITTTNLEYVNDPLWNNLTGGVGNEKTWLLDYGEYGLASGPLTYCEPLTTWKEWQDGTAQIGWAPAWKDNQWIIEEADKDSRMTFSLKDGAFMTTHKVTEGADESGTFFLNAANHTLTTNNATILRANGFIANATNWTTNLVVLELSDIQLRVGVRRTNNEGDYLYVWNFVSEEYALNYVPEEGGDGDGEDPNFDHGDESEIIAVSGSKTWKIDTDVPFNWANLNGEFANNWNSINDIDDWTGYNSSTIPNIENCRITFTKKGEVTVVQNDGTKTVGKYANTQKTNTITFEGITPNFPIVGWISVATTDANEWKIVKVERNDVTNEAIGIWFGKRDPDKDEYMVFHFIAE